MNRVSLRLLALSSVVGVVTAQSQHSTPVPYQVQTPPLDTPWTYNLSANPWPEYPRPQLVREPWASLNGIWTYQPAEGDDDVASPPQDGPLQREIKIPSCIESGISGIQDLNVTHMWFRTDFRVPSDWNGREERSVLLNFEAVDYETTVFVNGRNVGNHTGGFYRFSFDVTDVVDLDGDNDLLVFVHDPTDLEPYSIPSGKQSKLGGHIWYRPCSGIWQPVWIESVPETYITRLDIAADMNGRVAVTVYSSGQQRAEVRVSLADEDGEEIASATAQANRRFDFTVDSPSLWSPDSPTLYNVTVSLGDDEVSSYTGFRTISVGEVNGIKRPLLNGEFVFQFGTLDQGYWPDGLLTPPNREAMVYDLEVLKDLGFNMLRKHIKIEPDLFYQACDQMGILVIQDMVSLAHQRQPTQAQHENFRRELQLMVDKLKSFPSIVTWVIYNEGWGQIRGAEGALTELVRGLDPSRLVDSVSGWFDAGFGDFHDNHHYASAQCGTPFSSLLNTPYDPSRIALQGEFGGIGHNVSIEHLWNERESIDGINQTYELATDLEAYNHRAGVLLRELQEQIELFACSGGVWTQTTDVEGEVNGLMTYDRRVLRAEASQWRKDIQGLYEAAASRGGAGNTTAIDEDTRGSEDDDSAAPTTLLLSGSNYLVWAAWLSTGVWVHLGGLGDLRFLVL